MDHADHENSDIDVADASVLGLGIGEIDLLISAKSVGAKQTSGTSKQAGHQPLRIPTGNTLPGVRSYVDGQDGTGYWDFIKIRSNLYLSITDAQYDSPVRLELDDEPMIKLRIMLDGALYSEDGKVFLEAGMVGVQTMSGKRRFVYDIQPSSTPLRMVVLHFLPKTVKDLALNPDLLGEPFRGIAGGREIQDAYTSIANRAGLLKVAEEIFSTRDRFTQDLRAHYLAAKAEELLCLAIRNSKITNVIYAASNKISERDVVRLHEARSILATHLNTSFTVNKLAKLIGLNVTKLKAGFRIVFGETIQSYRTQKRLETALSLLENTDLTLSEISFRVGYQYQANFTQAFKRQYGKPPSHFRKLGG